MEKYIMRKQRQRKMNDNRVILREKSKKYELSTEQEREEEFVRVVKEIQEEKPDSMIIIYAKKKEVPKGSIYSKEIHYVNYGNWIYGEFDIKTLAELVKEFENAYSEIIKKGYETK
jgi:inner membrane protein involved in colicin E2 resistance